MRLAHFQTSVIFAAILVLVGCQQRDGSPDISPDRREVVTLAPTSEPSQEVLRLLALGDSYTIGQGVEASARWPEQLNERLRENGFAVSPPEIIARTGWTTQQLLRTIELSSLRGPYDIVTLMIGVNNQFHGLGVQEYREDLVSLLDRAVTLAGGETSRVIVISIPDWGATPFASGRDGDRIRKEIDLFNAVNREQTAIAGARYVDVTPVSREAPTDPDLVADDGLHPSAKMYGMWVELILPEALAILRGQ